MSPQAINRHSGAREIVLLDLVDGLGGDSNRIADTFKDLWGIVMFLITAGFLESKRTAVAVLAISRSIPIIQYSPLSRTLPTTSASSPVPPSHHPTTFL